MAAAHRNDRRGIPRGEDSHHQTEGQRDADRVRVAARRIAAGAVRWGGDLRDAGLRVGMGDG